MPIETHALSLHKSKGAERTAGDQWRSHPKNLGGPNRLILGE